MNIKDTLIEVANTKGYAVKTIHGWNPTKFGPAHIIVIEGGEFRISFVTNVLHGVNYFRIHQVTNYLQGRTYSSPRFHRKHIGLVGSIIGETKIKLKEEHQS